LAASSSLVCRRAITFESFDIDPEELAAKAALQVRAPVFGERGREGPSRIPPAHFLAPEPACTSVSLSENGEQSGA